MRKKKKNVGRVPDAHLEIKIDKDCAVVPFMSGPVKLFRQRVMDALQAGVGVTVTCSKRSGGRTAYYYETLHLTPTISTSIQYLDGSLSPAMSVTLLRVCDFWSMVDEMNHMGNIVNESKYEGVMGDMSKLEGVVKRAGMVDIKTRPMEIEGYEHEEELVGGTVVYHRDIPMPWNGHQLAFFLQEAHKAADAQITDTLHKIMAGLGFGDKKTGREKRF